MLGSVWINGDLVDPAAAVVPVNDHGLVVGDGAFETLAVKNGEPFAVARHLDRLRRSLVGLGIEGLPDDASLREGLAAVMASAPEIGRIRVTATAGEGPLGSHRSDSEPTIVIAASAKVEHAPTSRVHLVPWTRNEHGALAGLKTTSYAENVLALKRATEHGADEAIFANTAGQLCEGTGSNIFVVVDDQLVTPPLSSGCLAGITRELVIEATDDVVEADLSIAVLATVTEAFLTSSGRDVQQIVRIDDRDLPSAPGTHTTAAMAAFDRIVERTLDP